MPKSFNRIKSVFIKDITWAKGNSKLLVIMLMPLFFIFFFSKVGNGIGVSFSISFTNAFIGILSTSQLFIEEKKAGTLQNLLISPLKYSELIIGKVLFSTSIILFFDLFSLILNHKLNLLFNPLISISLILFACFSVLIGCFLGLILENEKEVSVIAPFILILFIGETIVSKVSLGSGVEAFFPAYHIIELLNMGDLLNTNEYLYHSLFIIIYTFLSFLLTVNYTQFYFSPKRHNKFSKMTLILLGSIVFSLYSSYLLKKNYFNDSSSVNTSKNLKNIQFTIDQWRGDITFDPKKSNVGKIVHNSEVLKIDYSPIRENFSIHLTIQKNESARKATSKASPKMDTPIGSSRLQSHGLKYTKIAKVTKNAVTFYTETIECNQYSLKFSAIVYELTPILLSKLSQTFDETIKNTKLECKSTHSL